MPVFSEPQAYSEDSFHHQIALLRWVNQGLKQQVITLSDEKKVLQEHVSILLSMLCDAGIPLPPDVQ